MEKKMLSTESRQSVMQSKTSQLCSRILIITLLVLTTDICLVQTATCPSSVPSSAETITEICSFNGYSNTDIIGIVGGPISNCLYYLYSISSANTHVAVKKVDVTGFINWMASFTFWPVIKSLAIDAAEQSVYFADYAGANLIVLKLSTTDGAVVSQHKL